MITLKKNQKIFRLIIALFVLFVALPLSGCGANSLVKGPLQSSNEGDGGVVRLQDSQQNFLNIPVRLHSSGLSLEESDVETTSFNMNLDGCKSETSENITGSFALIPRGDSGCLVKLVSFDYNQNTYKTKDPFKNWLANDSSQFVNTEDPQDLINVKVQNQLTQSQVSPQDHVRYAFSLVSDSNTSTLSVGVTGQEAPAFVLSTENDPPDTGSLPSVIFKGIDANGAGLFVFNLYCKAPIVDALCGESANDSAALSLSEIRYKLVADTFGAAEGVQMTAAELESIMSSGTSAITLNSDLLTDNNGGFKTAVLTGPGTLSTTPHMVLVLTGGTSYSYFPLVVQTLSNE